MRFGDSGQASAILGLHNHIHIGIKVIGVEDGIRLILILGIVWTHSQPRLSFIGWLPQQFKQMHLDTLVFVVGQLALGDPAAVVEPQSTPPSDGIAHI